MDNLNDMRDKAYFELANTKFEKGKYTGKTYKYVRENDPKYFLYLSTQPLGTVFEYYHFVRYCLEFLKTEELFEED